MVVTILLIIYGIVALTLGYFWARDCFINGGTDFPPGNLWTSLFMGFIFGVGWPIVAFIYGIIVVIEWLGEHPGRKIGTFIFGKPHDDHR